MKEQLRNTLSNNSLALFSSRDLCIAGLCIMPAFLFNPSLEARFIQTLLFISFTFFLGKKVNFLTLLLVSTAIIAFNMLLPHGRIITQWGPLRITEGALVSGIQKALTLEGLILLSRSAIRSDLRLPGFFGSLISDSFRIFEKISELYRGISWKQPIQSIDSLLLQLSVLEEEKPGATNMDISHKDKGQQAVDNPERHRRIPGRIILLTAIVLSYLPLILLAR